MQMPSPQDRTEIYELYARYSWALDTGDTDGYVALFTEDAEVTEETSRGDIEFRNLHFAYGTGPKEILGNKHIDIQTGKEVTY